eukprot:5366515-Pyramimonas_sp.AAC.1
MPAIIHSRRTRDWISIARQGYMATCSGPHAWTTRGARAANRTAGAEVSTQAARMQGSGTAPTEHIHQGHTFF